MRKRLKKTTRHTARRKSFSYKPTVISSRFIIITSFAFVLLVGFLVFNRRTLPQSVLGASIIRPLYAQATISWDQIPGAINYNIYYKEQSGGSFIHAVRKLPAESVSYTITYLKKGTAYKYKISAVDASQKEFWWSGVKWITNIVPM